MKSRFIILVKIIIAIVLLVFLLFNNTGCWNRLELDELAIVIGVGIDQAEEPDNIQITAQFFNPGETSSSGQGDGELTYFNLNSTADSVNRAIRRLDRLSSRQIYFPHNQVLAFSQQIANAGVQQHLDFFLRNHETRLSVLVLVVNNKTSDLFGVKPNLEKMPALVIADLLEVQVVASKSKSVNLQEFLTRLMSKTTAPVAPFIEVKGEENDKTMLVSGMAVFKEDKMVGRLNDIETRGMLWVIGEVQRGIIDVPCPGGEGKASLEITRASSKITPEIKDGKVHIKININEEGNLGGQSCPENLALPPNFEALETEKKIAIRNEVMAALTKARELNTDIFGFGDAVHKKYRKEWPELENKWDEIFPDIEVEVIVDAKLRRTGRITAINPEKE